MILGVMSDTHGNRKLMHKVAGLMERKFRVEVILHLGDDYADAEDLAMAGHAVRAIPGLWCAEYHDPGVPNTIVEAFDGVTVACAHAEKDLRARERAATIVVTGHTHTARIEHLGRSLYVNPGHLKKPDDRGKKASFAILDISPNEINASIHELSGKVRIALRVPRADLA